MLIDKDAAIAAIKRLEIDGSQMIWSSDAIDAVQGVEEDVPHVPDVEKVITGLKSCDDNGGGCDRCPYYETDAQKIARALYEAAGRDPGEADSLCMTLLLKDALALIEAQRRTLDEIDKYVRELDKAVNGDGRGDKKDNEPPRA